MNKTSIEWTQFSSNPLYVVDRQTGKRGWFCEKVSPGCALRDVETAQAVMPKVVPGDVSAWTPSAMPERG